MEQKTNGKRMVLAVPVFILVAAIIVWAKFNSSGFQTLWRYFAWSNQTLSLFAFLAISVWMFENGKSKWVWIPLIPGCFYTFICSMWKVSARVRRSARSAVSPEVMGRTMTPTMAMMPPMLPRMSLQTMPIV